MKSISNTVIHNSFHNDVGLRISLEFFYRYPGAVTEGILTKDVLQLSKTYRPQEEYDHLKYSSQKQLQPTHPHYQCRS